MRVQDQGIGIPAEALKRIFDAFEQANNAIAKQAGGLGLGLSIAKSLLDKHGGTIEAHSEGEGKGATFIVKLRCTEEKAEIARSAASAAEGKSPIEGYRILVVEDNESSLAVIARLLTTRLKHEVTTARSAEEAIRRFSFSPSFDLLISDIGLPDKSGLDLLRSLRALQPALPAIALSGLGSDDDVRASAEAGFHKHLTKPVSFAALSIAIAEVLESRPGERRAMLFT